MEYDAGYADDFEREAKEHGGDETPCLVLKTEVELEREEEREERDEDGVAPDTGGVGEVGEG